MRIVKIFIVLLSTATFAQNTPLTDAEISGLKDHVAKTAQNLERLSSDFVQTKHMQLMQDVAVSAGKIYYMAPDVIKWEYRTPYNYKILFKDNQMHINDDGEMSVTSLRSHKLFEKLVNLISGSVNGKLLADTENFDVSYFKNGKNITAVIIPRDGAIKQMFGEIILVFNEAHMVDSVKLMEEQGDYTRIDFKNIKINPVIDASVFKN